MSSSSGKAWYARLGKAIFGSPDGEGTRSADGGSPARERSAASLSVAPSPRPVRTSSPLPIAKPSPNAPAVADAAAEGGRKDAGNPSTNAQEPTAAQQGAVKKPAAASSNAISIAAPSSSSSSSSKRKNLQAILSSSYDDRSKELGSSLSQPTTGLAQPVVKERIYAPTSSHHRTSSDDRGSRKSGDNLLASPQQAQGRDTGKGIGIGRQAVPTASPSTLSTSLSQGVKTLTDRYQSSKEATETFNQMRERSDDRRSSISDMLKAERALQARPSLSASPSASSLEVRQGEGSTPSARAVDVNATANLAVPSSDALRRTPSQSSDLSSTSTVSPKPDARASPVVIPEELILGEKMLKVTSRKVMQRIVRIDADAGQILWDSKKNNCVNLETIREVRTGSDARSQRASLSIAAAHEDRWISIIYQSATLYKTLHLIALSEESFARWRSTLLAVQEERKMLASCVDMLEQRQSIWLRQHFKYADASQDARLDFDEVVRLCRRLGIMSSRADLQRRFNQADKESAGYLDFANFQHFVAILKRRVDVEELFERWAEPYTLTQSGQGSGEASTKLISRKQFGAFLHCEQGFASTSSKVFDSAYAKFATVRSSEGLPDPVMMDCNGFLAFLLSSDNSIVADQSALTMAEDSTGADDSKKNELDVTPSFSRANAETTEDLIAISGQLRVTQDMTRPLSDYYISSSHNTYLVGGQLTGESTAEGYIRALMQGARSVELDCWDGPNNDPVVTHGRTLTSKVPLRDVIRAVERYAFVASPYPLILSLEVHNGLAQQDAIVSILRSILSDKLLSEPLTHITREKMQSLPSPTDLMGKVLVKTKNVLLSKPPDEPERFEVVNSEKLGAASSATTDTTESESDNILSNARELIRAKLSRRKSGRRVEDQAGAGGANGSDKKAAMSASLAALLIYTVGVKHRGINKKETYAVEHMISLSERTANKYAKSAANGPNVDDLIKHNRTHLTRIYPSMHKLARLRDSANFMPNLFWSMGCQLVALNWQTLDLGFEMNQAMFTRNGNCGYVLKPEALRQKSKMDLGTVSLVVEVTIVSAQQLPKLQTTGASDRQGEDKVMDPYVCVSVNAPELRTFNVSLFKQSPSKPAEEKDDSQKRARRSISSGTEPARGETNRLDEQRVNTNSSTGSEKSGSSSNGKNRWFARSRTSTVRQNGFNPNWNETLAFRIRLPGSYPVKEDDEGAGAQDGEPKTLPTTKDVCQITRGLLDMCFLRFEVRDDVSRSAESSSSRSSSISGGSISADGRTLSSTSSQGSRSTSASSTKPLGTAGGAGSVAPSDPSRSASDSTERPLADVTQSDHDPQDDGNSPCVATYTLSLGAMQMGYHHVPLFDEATLNRHLFSTLFVRTQIRLERTTAS